MSEYKSLADFLRRRFEVAPFAEDLLEIERIVLEMNATTLKRVLRTCPKCKAISSEHSFNRCRVCLSALEPL